MTLKKICTFNGARSVAFKRAFKRLEDMEAANVPTLGVFGSILSEELKAARVEGLALIDAGDCLEGSSTTPTAADATSTPDVFTEAVEE